MENWRVLHAVTGGGSGATRVAVDLALGHKQNGLFEPMIFLRSKRGANVELRNELKRKGIKHTEVITRRKLLLIQELVGMIKDFQPHVLAAHGFSDHLWARIAGIIAKVPVIIQVEHARERYLPQRYLLSQILYLFTDALVCVSNGVRESLIKRGFSRRKMHVIYSGISLAKFVPLSGMRYADREKTVVTIARFARGKDQATLIRAAMLLKQEGINCNVLLVGGGNLRHLKKCQGLSHRLDLDNIVQFLGARKDVPELLQRSRISVLPTHREGFGLAILEAMAAGCLTIGSKVMGVIELIEDGKNGFLVKPRDPVLLAALIKTALADVGRSEMIAQQGQSDVARKFSLERMTSDYEKLFLELMHKKSTLT